MQRERIQRKPAAELGSSFTPATQQVTQAPTSSLPVHRSALFGHSLNNISIHAPSSITAQREPEEEEHAQLMRDPFGGHVQREPEEEPVQMMRGPAFVQREADPEEEQMQAQAFSDSSAAPSGVGVSSRIQSKLGGGQNLDAGARDFLEPRFGYSFENVRIHADGEADALSKDLGARAFTTGQDIFFRSGEYQPASSGGQQLLAHELTHTIQQARGPVDGVDRGDGIRVSDPGDVFENAAQAVAENVISGEFSTVGNSDFLLRNGIRHSSNQPGIIQRNVAVASLVQDAAVFSLSLLPSGSDSFENQNVNVSYCHQRNGQNPPQEISNYVFAVDSVAGLGASRAYIGLKLNFDGHNIISANTFPIRVHGYEGGILGSSAAVNFNANYASQPENPITAVRITFVGFNNPSGIGFQRFRGEIMVYGDGRIVCSECVLTDGDGIATTNPTCYVGWRDVSELFHYSTP
jgi:Domain of unknown function (DUF4157)